MPSKNKTSQARRSQAQARRKGTRLKHAKLKQAKLKQAKLRQTKPKPIKPKRPRAAGRPTNGEEAPFEVPRPRRIIQQPPVDWTAEHFHADEWAAAAEADVIAVQEKPLPRFGVVGIGASAGGLEAMTLLLAALGPQDVTFAIVIVQHLSPGHDSALPDLLSASTSLPVVQVTNGMVVGPGRVYVIPPNTQMEFDNGALTLQPRPDDRSQHMPIDHFFRSLAEHAQNRAVGVVLSGSATDGAEGLREIKAAGGITMAQEPQTAKYDSMPRAAIATGAVDLVLKPADISQELLRIMQRTSSPPLDSDPGATEAAIPSDEQFSRIFSMLRNASGVDFKHYKAPTIRRRLQRRMVLHKQDTIDLYIRFLQQNPAEVLALYQDILIHVTRFFRDTDSFTALVNRVLPRLKEERDESPIRIWVPGCSTGEEAYSIAIALVESLGDGATRAPIQIFATDVSELAIERARSGVYPENISADVSAERLRRFFSKVDGSYRINKQIRDLCIFARQDLTRDPPFSRLDLIVCRNVLIYLGPLLQRKLMSVFHYALKPSGYLMLGSAETIGGYTELFSTIDKRNKIYQKKPTVARAEIEMAFAYPVEREQRPMKGESAEPRATNSVQNEANRIILSRYAPPGVLVDSDLKIIQFRGHTGAFLEPAPGDASLDLLKMAREGLLYGLRTAVNEARRTNTAVRKDGLRVKHNGTTRSTSIEVVPLPGTGEGSCFLILFETSRDPESFRGTTAAQTNRKKPGRESKATRTARQKDRVWRLEQELAASRDYLQSLIQDLESANEELQSANEEILSANEELQSTNEELDTAKEELQSTNEELNTVNEELQARNEELSRVNSDLVNLLGSVQIAIVMVTIDLRIRRFTPMAERVLNLIPTDVGRPIGDIKPNIDCPDLERLIMESIDTVSIKERECRDRSGNSYLLRVRPYKSLENRIDGAVLALFDIAEATRRYDVSAAARAGDGNRGGAKEPGEIGSSRGSVAAILESVRDPMIILDDEHQIVAANQPFADVIGESPENLRGRSVYGLGEGSWDSPELRTLLETELAQRRVVESFALRLPAAQGDGSRDALVSARRVSGGDGRPPLLVLAFQLP